MGHTRHRDTTPTISLKMCGDFFCLHGCDKTPAFTSICGQREGLHKAHHQNYVWRWMTNSCVVSLCMRTCAHASNVPDIYVCGVCMYVWECTRSCVLVCVQCVCRGMYVLVCLPVYACKCVMCLWYICVCGICMCVHKYELVCLPVCVWCGKSCICLLLLINE